MNAHSEVDGLIVDVPEQLSNWRRWTEAGLSGVAMAMWLLALRPALLLAAWLFGFGMAHTQLVSHHATGRLIELGQLAALSVGLTLVVFAWERFKARRPRGLALPRGATDPEAMAAYFQMTPQQLAYLQQTRSVTVERPAPRQVMLACADGTRFAGHHDPLGPRPVPSCLKLMPRLEVAPAAPEEIRRMA